jgi:ATP-dependent DNA helicase RecQ
VYDILTQAFDIHAVAKKMYMLFKKKERLEIQRIHDTVGFLESDSCLSKRLAKYFGEHLEQERCGHCSFCKTGKAVLQNTTDRKPLSQFQFNTFTHEFVQTMGEQFTKSNLNKFLCGIYAPVFSKYKIKKLPHFGVFENYPFLEVRNWIDEKK